MGYCTSASSRRLSSLLGLRRCPTMRVGTPLPSRLAFLADPRHISSLLVHWETGSKSLADLTSRRPSNACHDTYSPEQNMNIDLIIVTVAIIATTRSAEARGSILAMIQSHSCRVQKLFIQ